MSTTEATAKTVCGTEKPSRMNLILGAENESEVEIPEKEEGAQKATHEGSEYTECEARA